MSQIMIGISSNDRGRDYQRKLMDIRKRTRTGHTTVIVKLLLGVVAVVAVTAATAAGGKRASVTQSRLQVPMTLPSSTKLVPSPKPRPAFPPKRKERRRQQAEISSLTSM